jgi:hypothetical protein
MQIVFFTSCRYSNFKSRFPTSIHYRNTIMSVRTQLTLQNSHSRNQKKITEFTLYEGLSLCSQITVIDSTLKPDESSLLLHNSRYKNVIISLEYVLHCRDFCGSNVTGQFSSELCSTTDRRDKRSLGSVGGKTFVPLLLVRRPTSPRFGN